MSLGLWIGAAVLGGLGAVGRATLTHVVILRLGRAFPYGTLAVNGSGALALGVLSGAAVTHAAMTLVGAGLLGGYTTFSTWMVESDALAAGGRWRAGAANVVAALALGLTGVWLGRQLGTAL